MTNKAINTRRTILVESHKLFAEKGFKAVTMKDVCAAAGLSRGGLYRYFSSTSEIMQCLLKQEHPVSGQIQKGVPARQIMEEQLEEYRKDMLDREKSLSLAIYEFASVAPKAYFAEGNMREKMRWSQLICYGMGTGEFKQVDVDQMADLILYSYQGVRMWSRILQLDEATTDHVLNSIREMLYPDYGRAEQLGSDIAFKSTPHGSPE